MNLLIHDFATAIEREAKAEPRSEELVDPAGIAAADEFTIRPRAWRVARFAFEVDADDRPERRR